MIHAMPNALTRSVTNWCLERVPTPLGAILLVTDDADCVRALDWDDHAPRLLRLLGRRIAPTMSLDSFASRPTSSVARTALDAYFSGNVGALEHLAVAAEGTLFQQSVWAALRQIPAGHTTSYGALAADVQRPRAVRAVGQANGSNPIGLIVPCHRVISASGDLTGYAGGLARKRWLLAHERAHAT